MYGGHVENHDGSVTGKDVIVNKKTYYVNFFDYMYAECVYPDSNILTSLEGESIKAKDIKEGNNIVYYNFETKETEVGKVEKVYT